jgi:hypothetical protein
MTTLDNINKARIFSEAYLCHKFKDNDEFFKEVFEEWCYNSKIPLEDFLRKKYFGDK